VLGLARAGPAEAQKFFDQGLALLYGFNRYDALRSFRKAAELDPQAAMAHWGMAMAQGPTSTFAVHYGSKASVRDARASFERRRLPAGSDPGVAYVSEVAMASPPEGHLWQIAHVLNSTCGSANDLTSSAGHVSIMGAKVDSLHTKGCHMQVSGPGRGCPGYLLAYQLDSAAGALTWIWPSTVTSPIFEPAPFAIPTVVNGYAYAPAYGLYNSADGKYDISGVQAYVF
jgi:hypothetical protein